MNLAWEMLRANYKSDGKGRYKTVDAMEVAKHFAEKTEQLQSQYDIALGAIRVGVERIEQLTSGPGGIMEMKQTIADKEKRIYYLEAILRDIQLYSMDPWAQEQAIQAKVPLKWTENYGQGSEPWLNKE